MAEAKDPATPPATSGGLTKEEVGTLIGTAIAAALKPDGEIGKMFKTVSDAQGELKKNVGVIANTLKDLPPAGAQAAATGKTKDEEAKTVSPDDVKTIVAAELKSHQEAQQQTAEQKAKRDAFIANPANGIARLPAAVQAQLGNDPAKWGEEAKTIKTDWDKFVTDNKITVPDVGNGTRDGGKTPSQEAAEQSGKKSGFLQMPGTANAPTPAAS